MKEKVVVARSGGKDSALALYKILNSASYNVLELLTTVTEDNSSCGFSSVTHLDTKKPCAKSSYCLLL